MEFESFLSDSNEVAKGIGICREVVKNLRGDPDKCASTNVAGNQEYALRISLPNGEEVPVTLGIIPEKLKTSHDKVLVRAEVAKIENIPALNTEGFFRALLKLNSESDTAWAGINEEKYVVVKSQRMVRGMDVNELTEMVRLTAKLTADIRNNLCVIHNVKPVDYGSGTGVAAGKVKLDEESKQHQGVYWESLNSVHLRVNGVVEACNNLVTAKDYVACNKLYFKASYDILEEVKQKGAGSKMLESVKEDVERAIADIPYFQNEQSKYNMFKELFEGILKVRG